MPTISNIRLTNILYEDGNKRFNDEIFTLDGENSAIVLENGGGKTVLIHTVLQAVLPHTDLGERKIKDTLRLENAPAHIGIEWIISEHPRRYLTTAVSLFQHNNKLTSYRYAFEYEESHPEALVHMPFVIWMENGNKRPANKDEIHDYYQQMKQQTHNANSFDTISGFHAYLEEHYQIIHDEWKSIVKINRDEGGIAAFFDHCKTSTELFDRLIIPMVEDSIAGHEVTMFADMFEKQRESFHMYRNLQKSMREHEAIQHELETYVNEFQHYAKTAAAYETQLELAKGLRAVLDQDHTLHEHAETEYEADWNAWQEAANDLQKEQASYKIIQLQQTAEALDRAYQEKQSNYEATKEMLQEKEQLLASLVYAEHREAKVTYEQQRDLYKKEIETYDAAHDVKADETELEAVKQSLHGYYSTALEKIDKAITDKEMEKNPLEQTAAEVKKQFERAETELQEMKGKLEYVKGQLTTPQSQNTHLKQKLLANPDQENVRTVYEQWIVRQQELDELTINLQQEKKVNIRKMADLSEEKEMAQTELNNIILQVHDEKGKTQTIKEAEDKVKEKLATVRPSWQAIDDLYLQEARVASTLEDMQEKKQKEREDALYKERLASRFVDDYGAQDIFFADPFLAERLTDWQNHFFIFTGLEYTANMEEADRARYEAYPLWPLTLVTTRTDKSKLEKKVAEIRSRLQYPVIILTTEEAKQVGEKETEATWIAPAHWEKNTTQEAFLDWKDAIRKEADGQKEARKAKDNELSSVQEVVRTFEQFFTEYPKVLFDELQEDIQAAYKEKDSTEHKLSKVNTAISQHETSQSVTEERLGQVQEEKQGLDRQIELATQYLENEQMIQSLTASIRQKETEAVQLDKEQQRMHRSKKRYEEDIALISEQIREQQNEKRILEAETLYEEVNRFPPKFTDETKAVLSEQKEKLEDHTRGIRQQYGVLEEKHKQVVKDITRMDVFMDDVLADNDTIDTAMDYPIDGEKQIQQTKSIVKTVKQKVETQRDIVNKAEKNRTAAMTRTEIEMEKFTTDFAGSEVVSFDIDLEEVPAYLTEKNQASATRKDYLETTGERIRKEKKNIDTAISHLEKYEIAHPFNHPGITASPLTEADQIAFPYERIDFVYRRTDALAEQKKKLDAAQAAIEQAKNDFRHFCRETISEHKLQKMAIDGIEMKTTYDDVLEFHQNMMTTLERAQMHAREYISRNDKEVQAFINSIHNHLVNVTNQLRVIPQNTRVKTGDKWKEIYKFTIPEWKEEDGKSKLRDYMDWILKQLESDRFKNNEAKEDTMKVRKEVEKWLQTKQLLQIVMGNHQMKAACRKVTNDNQVTSGLTSWEESNNWSGGEKWSKNMTLFLGILNFVAEKKQYITSNMRRHRAVILDNPFGKASSDHVLSPVFFIAEQLGFQMIALTAHVEGRFLQDYFPVNFSCRLVQAVDSSAQIMTKEKNFEHVYFQDHEPEEMARLEEREQLELF